MLPARHATAASRFQARPGAASAGGRAGRVLHIRDLGGRVRMGPSLAVCVINHQGREVLASTLAAVRAQRPPPAEIVLVDNASTDGGPDHVHAWFPEVRVVRLPE